MSEFYEGRRLIDSGNVAFDKQKATIYYTVFERWENILTSGVRCGAKEVFRISRTVGFSREQKAQFDSALAGSLGLQALANFETRLSVQTSLNIRWALEDKIEKEFEVTAPECGAYIPVRYQLVRDFELKYYVRGWFRERGWPLMVTERLEQFHDGSQLINRDPACNCPDAPKRSFHGLLHAAAEKLSFWIPFRLNEDALEVTIGRIRAVIRPEGASKLILRLPTWYLPPDLLFLAGEERPEIVVGLTLLEVREGMEIPPAVISRHEGLPFDAPGKEAILSPLLIEGQSITPQFRSLEDLIH